MVTDSGPAHDARSVLEAPLDSLPSPEDVVRAAMAWHFDERTGSPFWLQRARSLPFDPRTDIRTPADLAHFPDVSAEWREVPVEDLIPRGCANGRPVVVYESGGTTGAPKRVATAGAVRPEEAWMSWLFDLHGVPHGANWLHVGPTGPHLFGLGLASVCRTRGGIFYSIDLDPRWVKKCIAEGRAEDAGRYAKHLIQQAATVLSTQRIEVMSITPPLLEGMSGNPQLAELIRAKVKAIVWAGTSMSTESRRLLETEILPNVRLIGLYGNTMMGGAVQRPRQPGDTEDCVMQAFYPYVQLSVIDPKTRAEVPHGQRGQVLMNRLDREVFLPNVPERDSVLRIAPVPGFPGDGVADVQPLAVAADDDDVIEGVY